MQIHICRVLLRECCWLFT
ncbi:BnaAnng02200D [Brassica napus]|uniref:BnaAnng02200D protein n=1 Tax=Brassica napus TaxID=3708 RepID=A0A078FCF6_BRANA|nr:BnaAnng02200D [Brassica napus]